MERALILLMAIMLSARATQAQSIPRSFMPSRDAYAKRLVTEHFQFVQTPEQMPQALRAAFYRIAPRGDRWREVFAAIGYLDQTDYRSFIRGVKSGRFEKVTDRWNL